MNIKSLERARSLSIGVDRDTLESISQAFDCHSRPDCVDECILDAAFVDDEDDFKKLAGILGGVLDNESVSELHDADYYIFHC